MVVMERYKIRANLSSSHNSNNNNNLFSFQSKPISQFHLPPKPLLGRRSDDAELSIFDANRYFNEGGSTNLPKKTLILNDIPEMFDSATNPRDSSVSSVDGYGRNWRNRSFRATPTASSEASWNSQSGLLANLPGSVAVNVRAFPLNEKRKNRGGSFSSAGRRFFGRNCACYGKKSVDVEEKQADCKTPVRFSSDKSSTTTTEIPVVAKMKISAGAWANDSEMFAPEIGHRILNSGRPFVESAGFSFPKLAPPPAAAHRIEEDPARDSLEVFRPSDEVLRLPGAGGDDDVASDTSSDLFEIESFAAYRRRDSLEELSKLAGSAAGGVGMLQFRRSLEETAECYAPSEVSVEWSVTTAEAGFDRASLANFSSAASDYEEVGLVQAGEGRFGAERMAGNGGKKKGGGGLLSCRCENSVNVGPSPVRIGPEQRRVGSDACKPDRVPVTPRFPLETVELGRSHSIRLNRPIQTR